MTVFCLATEQTSPYYKKDMKKLIGTFAHMILKS